MHIYYPTSVRWIRSAEINRIKKFIKDSKVISFDIFDTTIIRLTESPLEIFTIMEYDAFCGRFEGFASCRIEAQKLAENKFGYKTDIICIYEIIKDKYGCSEEDINKLIELEIDTEIKCSIINKMILELIQFAVDHNKIIIFVSDMYLPEKYLRKIINSQCKIIRDYKIYSSCDYGYTKYSGKLFDIVKSDLPGRPILHIGDHYRSDFISAFSKKDINCLWNIYFGKKISYIDKYISYSTEIQDNRIYKWAFKEIAPALWGFCRWIDNKAQADNCRQLLFITREGDFFRQLFSKYDIEKKYASRTLFASRRSLLGSSADINWDYIAKTYKHGTIGHMLQAFHISPTNLELETKLSDETDFYHSIDKYKNLMFQYSETQRELLLRYIRSIANINEDIGFVDIGWKGSSQIFLQEIIRNVQSSARIHGYYLGEFYDPDYNIDKDGYICSSKKTDYRESVLNAGFIFENMFTPSFGTTMEYYEKDGNVEPLLDAADFFKDDCIAVAQKAIMDYFDLMTKARFKSESDERLIASMFRTLNNPSYAMAREMGNIRYIDYGEVKYVAKPGPLLNYLKSPKKFYADFHSCGWNSAFCRRLFKVPMPYYLIYKILKRLINK